MGFEPTVFAVTGQRFKPAKLLSQNLAIHKIYYSKSNTAYGDKPLIRRE